VKTDCIALGPNPTEEPLATELLGDQHCPSDTTGELIRYRTMLRERFPVPEGANAKFAIKTFDHDFGPYREVCAVFDEDCELSQGWAYFVESHLPAKWDETDVLVFTFRPAQK
jgi:hypothetical protein